jgi:hypothetical protein
VRARVRTRVRARVRTRVGTRVRMRSRTRRCGPDLSTNCQRMALRRLLTAVCSDLQPDRAMDVSHRCRTSNPTSSHGRAIAAPPSSCSVQPGWRYGTARAQAAPFACGNGGWPVPQCQPRRHNAAIWTRSASWADITHHRADHRPAAEHDRRPRQAPQRPLPRPLLGTAIRAGVTARGCAPPRGPRSAGRPEPRWRSGSVAQWFGGAVVRWRSGSVAPGGRSRPAPVRPAQSIVKSSGRW